MVDGNASYEDIEVERKCSSHEQKVTTYSGDRKSEGSGFEGMP